MIEYRWDQSLSPGNEQAFYWGSAAADADGTRNYMGVKSPAIDAMIAALLQARERDEFVSAVRALDRVLMSGFYVVPLFHLPGQWVARWTTIAHPADDPAVRLSAGNLVARTDEAQAVILGDGKPATDRQARRRAPRSTICSGALPRAGPDAIALIDPPNRAELHRRRAAPPDLCARPTGSSRPSPRGCAGSGCRPTPSSRIATSQHGRERADASRRAARRHDRGAAAAAVAARRVSPRRSAGSAPRPSSPRRASAASIIASSRCRSRPSCFPIRYVCGFGARSPGRRDAARRSVARSRAEPLPDVRREAAIRPPHIAVVTFDVTPDGLVRGGAQPRRADRRRARGAAGRRHRAGRGDPRLLRRKLVRGPRAHHGAVAALRRNACRCTSLRCRRPLPRKCREQRCDTVVLPGSLVAAARGGRAVRASGVRRRARVLARAGAAWRPPRLAAAGRRTWSTCRCSAKPGCSARVATPSGLPAPLPAGGIAAAPRDAAGAVTVADIARTAAGTLAAARTDGAAPSLSRPAPSACRRRTSRPTPTGFVDTGYPCRHRPRRRAPRGDRPAAGLVSVGGYRFVLQDLRRSGPPGSTTARRRGPARRVRRTSARRLAGDAEGALRRAGRRLASIR